MKVLDEKAFWDEVVRYFGVKAAMALIGWCVLTVVKSPDVSSERDLIERGYGAQSTRYRRVGQLREFRRHVESKGWTVPSSVESPATVALYELVAA